MLLNDDIVDIEKPCGRSSLTFFENELSRLFLYPPIFYIKPSRST